MKRPNAVAINEILRKIAILEHSRPFEGGIDYLTKGQQAAERHRQGTGIYFGYRKATFGYKYTVFGYNFLCGARFLGSQLFSRFRAIFMLFRAVLTPPTAKSVDSGLSRAAFLACGLTRQDPSHSSSDAADLAQVHPCHYKHYSVAHCTGRRPG